MRWFLLAHAHPWGDTDFSEEKLAATYRVDLANTLGNLVSRLTSLCEKAGVHGLAPSESDPQLGNTEQLESFRFDAAATSLMLELGAINREISAAQPWSGLTPERLPEGANRSRGFGRRSRSSPE